jgi:hypothetical protein
MGNLYNILKSAAYESLGKIKRWNRRKYLKIWDDQIKELRKAKAKEKIIQETAKFTKLEDKMEETLQ